jgi:uncharacterized membrane protein
MRKLMVCDRLSVTTIIVLGCVLLMEAVSTVMAATMVTAIMAQMKRKK